ncbi:NUDIX hydrolase [Brevundimonas pondensis]|uniref:NUDIX hydrolase n=1 Tax=Brevundimonas pondensis TaxID=2774189 RepID=UPI0028D8A2D9|nr:NUDIX hydrolase [uncultured Brevundimonas sp.]
MAGPVRTETSEARQVAVLPWRRGDAGVEVMMITSRETRRWVIPKGGRMVGKTDPQAAAQEAYEEAGVQGETLDTVIGHFRYGKRLKTGAVQACVVAVYPLEVLIQLGAWPEDQQRQRRWMPQAEAAEAVHEADLAQLIREFRPL